MNPTENPLFVKLSENEMVHFETLLKELGFDSILITNTDFNIEEDGDTLINEWNPGEIKDFHFAIKFWNHDDTMTALFVKPITHSAQLLWDTGKSLNTTQ
ncbi:hypothetical protein KCM76_17000 [Zooshikella marina]|uniref:hypothetical protein n=1 Tax=Zooshikella ganghwensis TaxID=202772 RepID=UPI001BAEDBF1|nr:hypothetical protein [Zooshikella ganghwensis]MBU2707693.1 hypothetical protein [Zooshikella ganghwensis]